MKDYDEYFNTTKYITNFIKEELLYNAFNKELERQTGWKIEQTLPDKQLNVTLTIGNIKADVDGKAKEFINYRHRNSSFTTNNIAAEPEKYKVFIDDLYNCYWESVGEWRHSASQPEHPGKPSIKKEELKSIIDKLISNKIDITTQPSLEDVKKTIIDQNYRLAAEMLNIEEKQSLIQPGGSHELTDLFTAGEVNIVYEEDNMALLRPSSFTEVRRKNIQNRIERLLPKNTLTSDERQWLRSMGVRDRLINGNGVGPGVRINISNIEIPELAFVIGKDDTPNGIFVHSIDGTELSPEQDVTKEYINKVMGFDKHYEHNLSTIELDVGERMRLQGDLAVEYTREDYEYESSEVCNLPIDNHLAMLTKGILPPNETKEQEPIEVHISEFSTLNIIHDEHDDVVVDLPPGVYTFYLLPRGVRPENIRPPWTEEATTLRERQAPIVDS